MINLEILYEDNHILIVNKPVGIPSQSDKTEDESILDIAKKYVKKKYGKPGDVYMGLPHRLDRPTSGVLVLAKTSKALERLTKMFNLHEVKKTYWAVVDRAPDPYKGTLKHYLIRDPKTNKSKAYDNPKKDAKEAILSYELLGASDNYFLLEIDLLTGRHHQIRAQLSKVGLHIKGDLKYGADHSNKNGGIHLHARKIEFIHPVSKENINVFAHTPIDPVWDYFYRITK